MSPPVSTKESRMVRPTTVLDRRCMNKVDCGTSKSALNLVWTIARLLSYLQLYILWQMVETIHAVHCIVGLV